MRRMKIMLAVLITFGVSLLIGYSRNEVSVSAATGDMLEILNGENKLFINSQEVSLGESGDGWSYSTADTLKLTGGASITSLIVTDDFEDGLGKRDFTIDITGNNTITVQKGVDIRFTTEETLNDTTVTVPKIHYLGGESICIYGKLTFTGNGTLNIINTAENPASHVIQSNGDLYLNGPSITVDMANAANGYHAASSMAWISATKTMKGSIYFNKGSFEVTNFGADTSALFSPEGLVLAEGATIVAGLDKATAKAVTVKEFWNFNEFGTMIVGPDPAMYKYMIISMPAAVSKPAEAAKPEAAVLKSLKSTVAGKVTAQITEQPGVSGYEIAYSTSSKFTTVTTKKVTTTRLSYSLNKLKSGKKYYFKIRAFVVDEKGEKIFGQYSKAKSITVK